MEAVEAEKPILRWPGIIHINTHKGCSCVPLSPFRPRRLRGVKLRIALSTPRRCHLGLSFLTPHGSINASRPLTLRCGTHKPMSWVRQKAGGKGDDRQHERQPMRAYSRRASFMPLLVCGRSVPSGDRAGLRQKWALSFRRYLSSKYYLRLKLMYKTCANAQK
jgi:hypothetical protein